MIENFDKELVKPASVRIRIDSIYKVLSKEKIDFFKKLSPKVKPLKLPYTIKQGEYIIGKSKEIFDIPNNLCFFHLHNSSQMRLGLEIIGGFGDPGYKGQIYFGIKNIGENTFIIKEGMSLSQVIVMPIEGKTIPLISRFLGGKII